MEDNEKGNWENQSPSLTWGNRATRKRNLELTRMVLVTRDAAWPLGSLTYGGRPGALGTARP